LWINRGTLKDLIQHEAGSDNTHHSLHITITYEDNTMGNNNYHLFTGRKYGNYWSSSMAYLVVMGLDAVSFVGSLKFYGKEDLVGVLPF